MNLLTDIKEIKKTEYSLSFNRKKRKIYIEKMAPITDWEIFVIIIFYLFLCFLFFTEILDKTYSVMMYYCTNSVFIYENAICIIRCMIMNKKNAIRKNVT